MEQQPTVSAVEVGEWPGLGGNVRLDLGERRTVLVGRNGAGKSLLVAGVFRGARGARWIDPLHLEDRPAYFRCDVRRPGLAGLAYEFRCSPEEDDYDKGDAATVAETSAPEGQRLQVPRWTERCWEPETGAEAWQVQAGTLRVRGHEPTPISPGCGLLAVMNPRTTPPPPPEASLLSELLAGFALIPAGVPRSDPANRREILVPSPHGVRRWLRPRGRIEDLAFTIATFYDNRRELYEEFVGLARRLGIVRDVEVKIYEDPTRATKPEERRDFASLLFDGLNIGLLSDGTLRISEMLINLIRRAGSVILIEEPETAVHPGLLSRLLSVIDSYSADRQVVISTHSPIVVDWCQPDELRLIERVDARTVSRSLSAKEAKRVEAYLVDEGTLSDFIYSQENA